jgi:ribosomal protein S18 acetylase RimI-like enzyme
MEFVSVNSKYQHQGIARELMRRTFALVSDCGDGKKLNLGGFTWDGEDYLRNIVKDGLQQYPGMLSAELEEIVTLQVFHC